MEDLAKHAVATFLKCLPDLVQAVELAIQKNQAPELEIAAHSLKGAVSVFFAEPARALAWHLEQLGKRQDLQDASDAFVKLKLELRNLEAALANLAFAGGAP